jgi:hypothetical protein
MIKAPRDPAGGTRCRLGGDALRLQQHQPSIASDPPGPAAAPGGSPPVSAVFCESSGSAIVVYNEKGNLIETITGFTFGPGQSAPVISPKARMGWVSGSAPDQLRQFFY